MSAASTAAFVRLAPSLSPTVHRLVAFLVFIAVPLVMGLTLLRSTLARWQEAGQVAEEARLQEALDRIVASQDAGFEVARIVRWGIQELRYRYALVRDLEKWNDELEKRHFPGMIIHCLQNGREFYSSPHHPTRPQWRAILRALPLSGARLAAAARRLDPVVRRLFGPRWSLRRLQRGNGEFLPVRWKGAAGLLFLEFLPNGQAVAWLFPRLSTARLAEAARCRARVASWRSALGKAVPLLDIWHPPAGCSVEEFRLAWALAEKTGQRQVVRQGRRWQFFLDRWGKLAALAIPAQIGRGVPLATAVLWLASGFVLLWGWRLLSRLDGGLSGEFRSIGWQLRLLFLYATFLPLLSAVLLGWLAVVDREDRLQQAAFTEGQLFLNVFEGGYPAHHQDFLARARRLRNALADPRVRPAQVEPWFNWLRQRQVAEFFYVPDAEGRTIFSNIDEPRAAIRDAFRILSRFALREFLPHRLPAGREQQVSVLDLLAEQCVKSEDLGWGTLIMNPGQVTPLAMGRSIADLYWDTYSELSTGPASIVITSNRHWQMGRYLRERFRSPGGQMQVAALDVFSLGFIDPVPEADRERLTELGSTCEKSGRTVQRRLALQNGPTWAVAQVDALSGRFALMALLDARRRLWPLTALRAALVLGVVVSVLVAALVGRLLAGLFLGPIRDLATGIEQIRQRRTEVRIPVRRADEFGALAQTFNQMIADLKELELARIVQAALLPARLPQIPGYSVAVINQTATRLGGDYWDLLALPGGRWLLLVGDVTGHGVPAALAMAMAKAGITFQALAQKTTATDFLEALNHVFFSELRAMRRFMTMLVGVFEPATHRLLLENAGQNFPVVVRNGAVVAEMLEMTGFPLGVRARLTTTRCMVELAAGDTLFFYTDGIPEVGVEGGDQLGYERMLAIMTQACQGGRPAATVLAEVLAAVERARRPGPFPDDVTLIVLRRDP